MLFDTFRNPPAPLSPLQRSVVWITAIAVAATRIWALSRSMWEGNEALFCSGVRDFDVSQNHPPPPGDPLFIAAAKVLRLLVHSDFRALQAVALIAALALFPLAFALGRQLRFPFLTAWGGALLFVFAPNVWYYGGTAFSDVVGVALLLAASVLLLRGCRDAKAYLWGAFVLALAVGVRPQALLAGLAPAALATWFQISEGWRRVVAAASIGVAVIAVSYGSVFVASESSPAFIDAFIARQRYVHDVDSYHNLARPPLVPTLVRPFFYEALRGGSGASKAIAFLMLVALVASMIRPHPGVWIVIATFAPLNVFSWLMLDFNASSRYAVSYAAMYAFLAAVGIELLIRTVGRTATALNVPLLLALVAMLARHAAPAIREVRRGSAPTAASMEWIRKHLDPRSTRIYVFEGLRPFASYALSGYDVSYVSSADALPSSPARERDAWFVTEGLSTSSDARNFMRARGPLEPIAGRRSFETSVSRAIGAVHFLEGWYSEEGEGLDRWRWMSGRGRIVFPPTPGAARLRLDFRVPVESFPTPPTLTVDINGLQVAQLVCRRAEYSRAWTVNPRADAPNIITITTYKTANPSRIGKGNDTRDLGLMLRSYSWSVVR